MFLIRTLLRMLGLRKREVNDDKRRADLSLQQKDFIDTNKIARAARPAEPAPIPLPDFKDSGPGRPIVYDKPPRSASSAATIKLDEPPAEHIAELTKANSVEKPSPEPYKKTEDQLMGMTCSCGETFLVPLALCGNLGVCPRCGAHVRLPEEKFVRMSCPCGMLFKVPDILSGRKGTCPQCKRQITIPEKCNKEVSLSPPLDYIDSDETFSDDLLDEVGQILLSDKLKTNRPASKTDKSQTAKIPQQPEAPLKRAENLHIKMTCSCGNTLMVPLAVSHRQIKCPKCHNLAKLADNNFIRMKCLCGMEFKVPLLLEGKHGTCPKCNRKLNISKNK